MDLKPGWKTTEFWTTTTAQVLGFLIMMGVLNATDAKTLGDSISHAIAAVSIIIVSAGVVVHYVQGRHTLKTALLEHHMDRDEVLDHADPQPHIHDTGA